MMIDKVGGGERGREGGGDGDGVIREMLGGNGLNDLKIKRKGGKIEWKCKIEGGAGLKKLISEIRKLKKRGGATPYLYIYNVLLYDISPLR